MTHASADLYDRGLDLFDDVASRLQPEDWDRPSPCQGWTALDVLGHLGTALGMGIALLQGRQPTFDELDRPADAVTGDPVGWYRDLAERSRSLVAGADLDLVMGTPMGPRTVADRLAFPAIDLFVHAWDIGRPAGIEVTIPDDLIAFAHAYIDPFPDEVIRGGSGAFGPEASAPEDATPTEAFVAWTGRPPR